MPVPQAMMSSPIDPIRRGSGSGFDYPARGHLETTLYRDGQCVPWGFRLVGGADVKKSMLTIQKIVRGSPAMDAGLQPGDVVTSINHKNATNMPHSVAKDLIQKAGNNLYLTINRGVSAPMSPPVSPMPNPLLAPLPTSAAKGHLPPPDKKNPETVADLEQVQFSMDKAREKQAIVSQPHRTLPVVQPGPKVRHDYPIGSYLDKPGSEIWSGQPSKPVTMSPVIVPIQAYASPAGQYMSSGQTMMNADVKLNQALDQIGANPDQSFVKNTYNSPIGLYSQQNVANALKPQIKPGHGPAPAPPVFNKKPLVAPPPQGQVVFWPPQELPQRSASPSMPRLTSPARFSSPMGRTASPMTRIASPTQRHVAYDLAHHIPAPIHLTPAGVALPNTGMDRPCSADITQSPTYQLVQEMEIGRDHGPVREVEYVVSPTDDHPGHMLPEQSTSFKLLRNSLLHEGQRA